MRQALCIIILLIAAAAAAAQSVPAPGASSQNPAKPSSPPPQAPHTNLKVGQPAPDFNLLSTINGPDGKKVRYKLSDFKGKKNVVLAFYVFAFTGG